MRPYLSLGEESVVGVRDYEPFYENKGYGSFHRVVSVVHPDSVNKK